MCDFFFLNNTSLYFWEHHDVTEPRWLAVMMQRKSGYYGLTVGDCRAVESLIYLHS